MKLSGSQVRQVQDALCDAFGADALRMMVRTRLDENLDEIATGSNMRQIAFLLIEWAERHGRTRELIVAARADLPGNPSLQALEPMLHALDAPAAPPAPAATPAQQPTKPPAASSAQQPAKQPAKQPDQPPTFAFPAASSSAASRTAPTARRTFSGPQPAGQEKAPSVTPAAPESASSPAQKPAAAPAPAPDEDFNGTALLKGAAGAAIGFCVLSALIYLVLIAVAWLAGIPLALVFDSGQRAELQALSPWFATLSDWAAVLVVGGAIAAAWLFSDEEWDTIGIVGVVAVLLLAGVGWLMGAVA